MNCGLAEDVSYILCNREKRAWFGGKLPLALLFHLQRISFQHSKGSIWIEYPNISGHFYRRRFQVCILPLYALLFCVKLAFLFKHQTGLLWDGARYKVMLVQPVHTVYCLIRKKHWALQQKQIQMRGISERIKITAFYVGFITSTMLEWCTHAIQSYGKGERIAQTLKELIKRIQKIYSLPCLCVLLKQPQLFPSTTRDAKTRRDPARFVHQICPICSKGLDCVSLSAIFGWWCSDELLIHERKSLSKCFPRYWRATSISQQPADSVVGHTVLVQVILISSVFFLQPLVDMNIKYSTQPSVCTQHNTMLTALQADTVNVPKEMFPVPVLSNSWKATMNRASGAHRTDSKAKNSWKEISLCGGDREYDSNHYIIRCHHFNVTAISSQDLECFPEFGNYFQGKIYHLDGINHNTWKDRTRNCIDIFITFRGRLLKVLLLIHFSYFEARDIRMEASSLDFFRRHRSP